MGFLKTFKNLCIILTVLLITRILAIIIAIYLIKPVYFLQSQLFPQIILPNRANYVELVNAIDLIWGLLFSAYLALKLIIRKLHLLKLDTHTQLTLPITKQLDPYIQHTQIEFAEIIGILIILGFILLDTFTLKISLFALISPVLILIAYTISLTSLVDTYRKFIGIYNKYGKN